MLSISDALRDVQRQFVVTLPSRIAALHTQYQKLNLSSWQTAEVRILPHQLHSLIGSAGTFGMQSLSAAVRQLEIRLKTMVDVEGDPGQAEYLSRVLRDIARSQHEKWDGSGYHNGLSGEQIPVAGRIAALANVFDALTSERPCKKAWAIEEAWS